MKSTRKIYLTAIVTVLTNSVISQVQIDHRIELTGSGSNAKIEGIEEVVNPHDAANKAYVDQAVSNASGGPAMSFSLNASQSSMLLGQGTSNSTTPILLTAQFVNGQGAPVSLSLNNVPAGVTFNLTPSGGFPSFTSQLVFFVGASVPADLYPITIQATGGGGMQSVIVNLTVALTKTVFVTSTTHNGNLGGLSGADAICNTRAAAGGLSGTYTAWLSTTSVHAKNRISDGLYARTDGALVALNKTDLTDGSLINPINRDEFGTVPSGIDHVSTGTDEFGDKWVFSAFPGINYSCVNWTSASDPYSHRGVMNTTGPSWTQASAGEGCSTERRLYCFKN